MTRTLALTLALLAAGTVQAADRSFDRSFTVAPGGTLTVEADGAAIRVSGADTNQVTVRMKVKGPESELGSMTLDATQNGNDVTATLKRNRRNKLFSLGSWRSDGTIEVVVPSRYAVNARTSGGAIEIKDTAGTMKLQTSGGDVTARNVNGEVRLRTSGGRIVAENIKGDVDADTSGGDLHLLGVDGKIAGNTSGGNVKVRLAGANRGISATTSGGDIELLLPPDTAGNVSASTSGGDVRSDIPVTTTSMREGRLEGTLNGGGETIRARTSGGNIRLRSAG